MSGWGKGWLDEATPISETAWNELAAKGVAVIQTSFREDNFQIEHIPQSKIIKNKHPTHDPYTNPNAHIYYECGCGAILDPGTKSFAQLNNCASEKGWKVRWGADSYQPYCVKCGEDVE